MRRKDREILELDKIKDILDECKVCRIGMHDDGEIYIVPMNFGYSFENDKLILYFHCAKDGRKINILNKNNKVGFEMDCKHKLIESEIPCKNSFKYASIIGKGEVIFIGNTDEKIQAFNIIMNHQTKKQFQFSHEMVKTVTMFKVYSENFTCKINE